MITLTHITEINGKHLDVDYAFRKTEFKDMEELDKYRAYIEKKLGKNVYFIYKTPPDGYK